MTEPQNYKHQTENFWVLEYYKSSSSDKNYEVRTSKRDHKTYCTCRGWIVKLNQSKVTGKPAECKHIKMYKALLKTSATPQAAEAVVVYNFDEFIAVKRSLDLTPDGKTGSSIKVRRSL